jgi:hypothetical protein
MKQTYTIRPNNKSIARQIYDELRGIQYGQLPDVHGWVHDINS